MSNTGVSTLFQKYLSKHSTLNTRAKESPRRTPSEANPWNLRVPGEGRLD